MYSSVLLAPLGIVNWLIGVFFYFFIWVRKSQKSRWRCRLKLFVSHIVRKSLYWSLEIWIRAESVLCKKHRHTVHWLVLKFGELRWHGRATLDWFTQLLADVLHLSISKVVKNKFTTSVFLSHNTYRFVYLIFLSTATLTTSQILCLFLHLKLLPWPFEC